MTTPKDNALHLMGGQGGEAKLTNEQITEIAAVAFAEDRLPWTGFEQDADGLYTAPVLSEMHFALVRAVLEAVAPKTALQHFADEVEASGEAAKHAHTAIEWLRNNYQDHPSIAGLCEAMAPILHADAAAARYEIATLKATLASSQELFARERGITKEQGERIKEMAAVLKDAAWRINDVRDMLMKENALGYRIYGCDEWSTPTVNLATAHKVITAALSKVQHVAARGAEVSE